MNYLYGSYKYLSCDTFPVSMDSARQNLLLYAGIAAVVVVVIAYLLINNVSATSTLYNQTISSSQLSALSAIANNQTLASTVGISSYAGLNASEYIKHINASQLMYGGKPEVLYVGAEFCPYCAGSRWALILALMRFGNLTGIKYSASSSTDVYPNTPTFSFVNSSYTSKYLSFKAFETETRTGQPLQTLDNASEATFSKYGSAIPFTDFGNAYVQSGSLMLPSAYQGLSWGDIISELPQSGTALSQAVIGYANIYTAEICAGIGNTAPVCSQNYVKGATDRFLS
jgi:hypothetical protein